MREYDASLVRERLLTRKELMSTGVITQSAVITQSVVVLVEDSLRMTLVSGVTLVSSPTAELILMSMIEIHLTVCPRTVIPNS